MLCSEIYELRSLLSQIDVLPSNADLISIVCGSCDDQEVCPAAVTIAGDDLESPASNVEST